MSVAQATRDAAVADVRAGMSIATAAKRHGVSVGSVHGWVRAAGGAPSVTAAPARPTGKANEGKRSKMNAGSGRSKMNGGEGERKRTREKAEERGERKGGNTPSTDPSRAHPTTAAELQRVTELARKGISQRVEVLANPASILHKDQVKIAVTIDYLTDAVAKLPVAFRDSAPVQTSDETAAKIADVFGAPPAPEPIPVGKLIEISGGKA